MQISRCRQHERMVPDNFKRNLHHFNMKKVEHVKMNIFQNERGLNHHFL